MAVHVPSFGVPAVRASAMVRPSGNAPSGPYMPANARTTPAASVIRAVRVKVAVPVFDAAFTAATGAAATLTMVGGELSDAEAVSAMMGAASRAAAAAPTIRP